MPAGGASIVPKLHEHGVHVPRIDWVRTFRQRVGELKNPRAALQQLRVDLGPNLPTELFESLAAHPMFRREVARDPWPRRFGEIWASRRMASRGLGADVAWSVEVLRLFGTQLTSFVSLEREFDQSYILGDWAGCLGVLDRLEQTLGLSLWLISRRLTVLRLAGGDSEKDYAESLIASATEGTVVGWLVFMMNFRADQNVAPASYVRQIGKSLAGSGLPRAIAIWLRYHALTAPPQDEISCTAVLAVSETLPIVDRYMALLDVLQAITFVEGLGFNVRSTLPSSVARLAAVVPDDRIQILRETLDPTSFEDLISRLDPRAADAYTLGDYAGAVEMLAAQLRCNPGRTNLYGLLARAMLRADTVPDVPFRTGEIIRFMASVHVFAEDDEAAMAELSREALTGAHRPLATSIRALFSGRAKDPSVPIPDANIEALNGKELTPLQLRNLPVPTVEREALVTRALERFVASPSLELQRAVLRFGQEELDSVLHDRLPPDRAALYAGRALVRLSRFDEGISLLRNLQDDPGPAVANDARRELFHAFTSAGRPRDALRTVAAAYRQNEKLHSIFALAPLLDEVEAADGGAPFDEIALSICYHINNRFGGDARMGSQADAAEEYALARGAELPSRIAFDAVDVEPGLAATYLDQVCSAQVLDKFMVIESVDQVELERLEICRKLTEIDPGRRQRYLEEIREITRRRVVRERFEQVERTKIYVDTEGVKRQADKTLRDTYIRFTVSLADDEQGNERIKMLRRVQSILSDIHAEGMKIHFADLPASERDLLFDRLVHDVMKLLISSQEYGLEAYLSTRVRHGTMGNQLRSAFELQSLLTQRDGGRYQPDYGWSKALGLDFDPRGEWLAQRLVKFSEDLDATIEDLVRRRIQVRSEAAPDGLFKFQAFNFERVRLQAEITPETPFEAFMDRVIDQFWAVLEDTLVAVRKYIEGPFLNGVHALTDELGRDVERELSPINISKLRDAVAQARIQMSVNVANVASWFTLARDMERPDYEFGIAVEVATESIRACHPSLNVQVDRTDEISFDCRGRTLESLVYVLFTALDNAVEHCGFLDQAPEIRLATSRTDGWLQLTLANSCAPVQDVAAANARLAELRDRLRSGADLPGLATTEGGSGYAKIIRILRHDLLARHSLEFGYTEATEYAVTIGVESKAIIK